VYLLVVQEVSVTLVHLESCRQPIANKRETKSCCSDGTSAYTQVLRAKDNQFGSEISLDHRCNEAVILPRYATPYCTGTKLASSSCSWPSGGVTVIPRFADGSGVYVMELTLDSWYLDVLMRTGFSRSNLVDDTQMVYSFQGDGGYMGMSPSCTNYVFGPSGKGICLETRNIGLHRDRHPARCVVGLELEPISSADERRRIWLETRKGKVYGDLMGESARRGKAPWILPVRVNFGHIYARRCGVEEVSARKYQLTAIAFEDTIGRVAIGDYNGMIEILSFT
jgi:hypothetical protein